MNLNRNRLYTTLVLACIAGYIWLYYASFINGTSNKLFDVCIIKHTTNMPCPSCGSTRSVVSILNGSYAQAFGINPLGYLVALIMFLSPIWIIVDVITKRNSLFLVYRKIEDYLKKPYYSFPIVFLVIVNWIWNISKGL